MLTYRPGDSLAHSLDPRAKLGFQVGFAAAAFGWDARLAPLALAGVVAAAAAASGLSLVRTLRAYALPVALLGFGTLVRAVRLGPPWIAVGPAADALLHSLRVLLVMVVAAAYVRTTPVRETRAVLARYVPGKPGRALGAGVGFVLRFLPVLLADLRAARAGAAARLGDERPVRERMGRLAVAGVGAAFRRADTLSLALQARCFAWNPTPPPLDPAPRDAPVVLAAAVLAGTAFV